MHKFDTAASGLEVTSKEKEELERRANVAALDLLKTQEQLGAIKSELRDIERKRSKQDRLLRDVNQVGSYYFILNDCNHCWLWCMTRHPFFIIL